jgi:ribosomal protein S18 acetylase RimI-like enzyme
MTVSLRPMTDAESGPIVERWRERFARNIVSARGLSAEVARQQAARDFDHLLPDGTRSRGQLLYVAIDDAERVGALWLSTQSPDGAPAAWICEVEVDDVHRGRGYGRAIMLCAEQECAKRGIAEIRLNVFGSNAVARGLYESLGYDVLTQKMGKRLSGSA